MNPLGGVHVCRVLEAVAEDLAIEDTLYCLDHALRNELIDFPTYIKVPIALYRSTSSRAMLRCIAMTESVLPDGSQAGATAVLRAGHLAQGQRSAGSAVDTAPTGVFMNCLA